MLEQQFISEGPRERPILAAQELLKKKLGQFAGQKFRQSMCRGDIPLAPIVNLGNIEIFRAANALRVALVRAGWIVVASPGQRLPMDPLLEDNCSFVGISAIVRPDAPYRTRQAAPAFVPVIGEILSQGFAVPSRGKTTLPSSGVSGDSFSLDGSDVIDIHIGVHPLILWQPIPRKTTK